MNHWIWVKGEGLDKGQYEDSDKYGRISCSCIKGESRKEEVCLPRLVHSTLNQHDIQKLHTKRKVNSRLIINKKTKRYTTKTIHNHIMHCNEHSMLCGCQPYLIKAWKNKAYAFKIEYISVNNTKKAWIKWFS